MEETKEELEEQLDNLINDVNDYLNYLGRQWRDAVKSENEEAIKKAKFNHDIACIYLVKSGDFNSLNSGGDRVD